MSPPPATASPHLSLAGLVEPVEPFLTLSPPPHPLFPLHREIVRETLPTGEVEEYALHAERGGVCVECGAAVGPLANEENPLTAKAVDMAPHERQDYAPNRVRYDRHFNRAAVIDSRNRDANGRSTRMTFPPRLRRIDRKRDHDHVAHDILPILDAIAHQLAAPRAVRDRATHMLRFVKRDGRALRQFRLEAQAAGAFLAGARSEGLYYSFREVARAAQVEKREAARAYRRLADGAGVTIPPPTPADYLRMVALRDAAGGVTPKMYRDAIALAERLRDRRLSGGSECTPLSVAAGCAYLEWNEWNCPNAHDGETGKVRYSQVRIATTFGCIDVSVRAAAAMIRAAVASGERTD